MNPFPFAANLSESTALKLCPDIRMSRFSRSYTHRIATQTREKFLQTTGQLTTQSESTSRIRTPNGLHPQ
jgi:hypothetical protein